jgi:hypothetical protein
MGDTPQQSSATRTLDVTGLPDEAVAAVERLVALLKKAPLKQSDLPASFSSREEWRKAIREWVDSQQPRNTSADWDRESIYAGRGE